MLSRRLERSYVEHISGCWDTELARKELTNGQRKKIALSGARQEHRMQQRYDRGEPQCYQGLNEPGRTALSLPFADCF
jgi:hypothetical protein